MKNNLLIFVILAGISEMMFTGCSGDDGTIPDRKVNQNDIEVMAQAGKKPDIFILEICFFF